MIPFLGSPTIPGILLLGLLLFWPLLIVLSLVLLLRLRNVGMRGRFSVVGLTTGYVAYLALPILRAAGLFDGLEKETRAAIEIATPVLPIVTSIALAVVWGGKYRDGPPLCQGSCRMI